VSKGHRSAEAYRLTPPQHFSGEPVTYRARVIDGDAARADSNGFYHGMLVKHAGRDFVLTGPPALLVAGESRQLDLFAGLL